jgi:putative phosphoesterase
MMSLKKKSEDLKAIIVGLISDTHIPTRAQKIPLEVFDIFKNAAYIVHSGDLVQLEVIDELEQIAPVIAVHGNMDGIDIHEKLPPINSLKVYEWKIGIVHGSEDLFGRKMHKTAEENKFNVLVYGHTHRPSIKWENNVLLINPGSPTNPLPPFITKPTVGILKITTEKIEPEIISI